MLKMGQQNREYRNKQKPGYLVPTVGIIISLIATACGSSSVNSQKSAAAKKAPINIMGTTTLSGVGLVYPDNGFGLKAAVAYVNAHGGIAGHPLAIQICNDLGSPNNARSCAEKAVGNKDVAVLGPDDTQTPTVIPILQSAGIAFVGDIEQTQADATSQVSFPVAPGPLTLNAGAPVAAKAAGCRTLGSAVVDFPLIGTGIEKSVAEGARYAHITLMRQFLVPPTQTNLIPVVSAIEQQGVHCAAASFAESQDTAFLSANYQTGNKLEVFLAGVVLPSLGSLGQTAVGSYIYSGSSIPSDSRMASVVKEIARYGGISRTQISSGTLQSWASVMILAAALKTIKGGDYSASSVLKAMGDLKDVSTQGILPPYTSVGITSAERLPTTSNVIRIYKVIGVGKTSSLTGFISLPPLPRY